MNIRARQTIHNTAKSALSKAKEPQKIVLIYALICCGLSLGATVISALLNDRIAGTGGLGNIGLRSVLSTGQSVLPLINFIVTACLNLGYHTVMLSITRGFDASPRTLLSGFRHLGLVLRCLILQVAIYTGAGFLAMYLSSSIFMATPYSADFMEVMEPVLSSMTVMDTTITLDDTTLRAAAETMMPMAWILAGVSLVILVPLYYRFRMTDFCLADDPRLGAVHALIKSRKLMRRNCFALFRLDLSLWWFYAANLLITAVCYGDVLLPMVGIQLPWSNQVCYYLFLVLSLLMQTALFYLGMNRVYGAYAVTYDILQEEQFQSELPVSM